MYRYQSLLDDATSVLFWLGVVAATICFVDWLIRKRYISPFHPVARFFRLRSMPLRRASHCDEPKETI